MGRHGLAQASWACTPLWHSDRNHNALLGTRIGEASHPGPGGASASERIRVEKSEPCSDDDNLAKALLSVIQSHQAAKEVSNSRQAEQHGNAGAGKGKSNHTDFEGSSLASRLTQVLQAAIDHRWSDDKLIGNISSKLQQWQAKKTREPDPPAPVR